MNLPVTCRVAIKNDLPEILRLYSQPDMDNGQVLSLSQAEALFERVEQYPNYKFFVALYESFIVGTFALLIMDNLGHRGAPSAILEFVVVDPDFQGQGVGKAMMQYALDLAHQEGCCKAMLSSNLKRQRSHKFYEALGFERHGYSFFLNIQKDTVPEGTEHNR